LTDGFAGGTTPPAPARVTGSATNTIDDQTITVPAADRTKLLDRARAPVRCCFTISPSRLYGMRISRA
jgi:hypothetical protein